MKRKEKLPELLAPAGDFEALIAAVTAGADAVYVGGLKFGARAFAKNFSDEELVAAVKFCHMFGVRLYVTLNTLVFDKEVEEALVYAKRLYEIGVDALIIADLGMAALIKEKLPDLELHASTQMGIHNTEGVNFAKKLGIKRAVLARECSSDDIKKIVEKSDIECEVFLHGALCVCHSGQCLFSSMVGGRSGNRGECAQPCRLPYNGNKYPLSLSDLSLSNHITSLIDSGVSSLKIEGRMKSADYVYRVTRVYRDLLDHGRNSSQKEQKELADVFSRGGFTDGYYIGKIFSRMTGVRSEAEKQVSRELSGMQFKMPKLKIKAEASFLLNEPSLLTLTASFAPKWENRGEQFNKYTKKISVTVQGMPPVVAENAPLTITGLKERLSKTGNTPFELSVDDIEITLGEEINLAPSLVNALRREACDKLSIEYLKSVRDIIGLAQEDGYEAQLGAKRFDDKAESLYSVFYNPELLREIYSDAKDSLGRIFVPLESYDTFKSIATVGAIIPPIIMENEWESVKESLAKAVEGGIDTVLIGNVSHIALANEFGLRFICDMRLNTANCYSYTLLKKLGANDVILSAELTLPMARDIGGAVITLGRIPLMITERCFVKENFGCEKCMKACFTDRKGAKFPILRSAPHRNIIFNSAPTYMGDKKDELSAARIKRTAFVFSSESPREAMDIIYSYKKGLSISGACRRIGKR